MYGYEGLILFTVAFFGLQYMDKYGPDSLPREARRIENSPKMNFRCSSGLGTQIWRVTRINVFFVRVAANTNQ